MTALELGFFAIPVNDLDIAKSFYQNVMGWEFKDRDTEFSYIFANDAMIGSLELATQEFRPSDGGPLLYFRADAMGETLAKVKASGGVVKDQQAIDGGARGYTAKVQDPFKNTVAFWAPEP